MPSNKKREQPQMKIRSPSFSCSSSASCTEPPPPPLPTVQPAKSKTKHTGRKINPKKPQFSAILGRKTSFYKGVTRHKWTGKFEAHIWDSNSPNPTPNRKGRQGGYDDEETAAHTHDLASLKYWGPDAILNFPLRIYIREFEEMQKVSKEEYIATLRRRSSGFSRGLSKYRGVARHHQNGRWEARIGCAFGNKYLYLGTFSTQEEAAVAYDLAAIQFRGLNAVTNFHISNYIKTAQVEPLRHQLQLQQQQQTSFTESQHVIPSQFPNPKHLEPVDYHKSMVVDSFEEHPWNSFMDFGLNPLPVLDTAQSSELLDLFNDRGFEENIELLFEESKENGNGLD